MAKTAVKKVDIAVSDDGTIDLKSKDRLQGSFKVKKIDEDVQSQPTSTALISNDETKRRLDSFAERLEQAVVKVTPLEHGSVHQLHAEAMDHVKVKFGKFVQLVASRDFSDVLEKNEKEDIILSSNLLTELASAEDDQKERKSPIIFIVGLAMGIILTYILLHK